MKAQLYVADQGNNKRYTLFLWAISIIKEILDKSLVAWYLQVNVLFNNQRLHNMTITNGFEIIDNALSLAIDDLKKRGLPEDEAHIALLIRLKHLVPAEVQQVADLLADDEELNARINPDFDLDPQVPVGLWK